MEERHILQLYRANDRRAVTASQERYEPFCHAIACNILGNEQDAEACVKEVWERAWEAFPLQPPAILSAGLGRITRALALERRSPGKRQEESEVPLAIHELERHGISSAEEPKSPEALAKSAAAFLRRFSMLNRMVFIRRYWYFNSLEVIARQLSLSEGRVSAILSDMTTQLSAQVSFPSGSTFLAALNYLPDDLIAEGNVRRRPLLLRIAVIALCVLLLLSSLYPFLRDRLH